MLTSVATPSSASISDTFSATSEDFSVVDISNMSDYQPVADSIADLTEGLEPVEDWSEGNLVLVTTDKYMFKVDRYHLLAARSFFLSVESAALTTYLNFIIGTPGVVDIPYGDNADNFDAMIAFTQFMVDYRCRRDLQHFRCWVLCALHKEYLSPLPAFGIGAIMDDPDLCSEALEADEWFWSEEEDKVAYLENGDDDRYVLNPIHLPFTVWELLPKEYSWALTRAWGLHKINTENDGRKNENDEDRKPTAEEFKEILEVVKANKKTKSETLEVKAAKYTTDKTKAKSDEPTANERKADDTAKSTR